MKPVHCLFVALAVLYCTTGAAQQPDLRLVFNVTNPVAVSGLPDAGYYVLTADRVVYRYDLQSGSGPRFAKRFDLAIPGDGTDIAFARFGGQDSVVVTQWADKIRRGYVRRYSAEGALLASWEINHIPAGMGFDSRNGRIYFATLDSNELYAVDLAGTGASFVCEIPEAFQLGPIALDVERQLVYASDADGKLFVVDLASKKTRRLSPTFGLASALLLDASKRILYVADHVKNTVYAVDVSTQSGRLMEQSLKLASPSGLVAGPDDTLLITDQNSGNVYQGRVRASPARKPQTAKTVSK